MSDESAADTATLPPSEDLITDLLRAEGVERIPVPYPGGREYICPACEEPIPNRRIVYLGKPAKYAHLLNDIIKCPRSTCRFIFSPKTEVLVVRQ